MKKATILTVIGLFLIGGVTTASSGTIYLPNLNEPILTMVDTDSLQISTWETPDPLGKEQAQLKGSVWVDNELVYLSSTEGIIIYDETIGDMVHNPANGNPLPGVYEYPATVSMGDNVFVAVGDQTGWVLHAGSSHVYCFDVATHQKIGSAGWGIPIETTVSSIVPVGPKRAYAGCNDGKIMSVELPDGSAYEVYQVANIGMPISDIIYRDGIVYTVGRDSTNGVLAILDPETDTLLDTISITRAMEIETDGRHLYMANHWDETVTVLDLETLNQWHVNNVGLQCYGITVSISDNKIFAITKQGPWISPNDPEHLEGRYDTRITVINTETHKVSDLIPRLNQYGSVQLPEWRIRGRMIRSQTYMEPNDPPNAETSPDQSVEEGVLVTLSGTNSSDDHGIVSYLWEQLEGTPVVISNHTQPIASFMSPEVTPDGETLTFRLTVSDEEGLTDSDTCLVNVVNVNQPPTANSGMDQVADEGTLVTLNASNSSDPDGEIVSYEWVQTRGPLVALSDPWGIKTTFITHDVGPNGDSLIFKLTVTDDGGLKDNDDCVVNVSWVNIHPQADSGPDQLVDEGIVVTLSGTNSQDPDDKIVKYQWIQTDGLPVTLSNPTEVITKFISPDIGPDGASLTFELTVTDTGGLQDTDSCIISVSWVNIPPQADAGEDKITDEGTIVTLDGSGSFDPDDSISKYLWTQLDGPQVTLSDPASISPGFEAPNLDTGDISLEFQLMVEDTGGLKDTDTCFVNVTWINIPPIADCGENISVDAGSEVVLDASNSSDADDGIAFYHWEQLEGEPIEFSDPSATTTTFVAPDLNSEISIRLTVTDTGGLKDDDEMLVTVIKEEDPPPDDDNKAVPMAGGGGGGGNSGCFIATAAYGSIMEKHVRDLQAFRDKYLLGNPIGKEMVNLYYRTSPPLANFISRHPKIRAITRITLSPVVWIIHLVN